MVAVLASLRKGGIVAIDEIKLRPKITAFRLDQVNEALQAVKADRIDGPQS